MFDRKTVPSMPSPFLPLVLTAFFVMCSCEGPIRKTSQGLTAEGDQCRIDVVCYAPDIIQVVKSPRQGEADLSPTASVVLRPGKVRHDVRKSKDGKVRLTTDSLSVELNIATGTIMFYRYNGDLLVREGPESETRNGISQGFLLDKDEAIYGLGQHKGSGMDQMGKEYYLENVNTEIAIPLVHSIKGYAIYWDNYSPTEYRSGDEGFTFTSTAGKNLSYFILGGGSADAVIRNIRILTGEVPMNPLWAFGFLQSRERYRSAEELVSTVRKYRELGVPLDGIIQDWQYWGDDGHWNAVQFLNPRFPDPFGMMDEIHGMHAHALISIWPSFGSETDIYKELDEGNLLLPNDTYPWGSGARVYDAWDSRAREIYWGYIERNLWAAGLDGWWLDATEPEHPSLTGNELSYQTSEGSLRSMLNSFPLYSVGGVYDHQRNLTDDRRVMILTRSATAGLQRYGAHVWSGDLHSTWISLSDQVTSALNLSLCGIPYHNSDIGGFYSSGSYPGGNANPGFRQLYDRWMQLAVFTGMMRSHGTHTTREIFQFGTRGGRDFDIQEAAIRLRYLLLPYIYTQAWRVSSEGASLMRPLFADWPEDRRTWRQEEEFLFGDALLVAPVFREDDTCSVYLPEGRWIDFWEGMPVEGNVSFDLTVPRDRIPVYVKAGTVLPVGPDVQYASERPWDDIQVRIYAGADGDFTLYEDEGDGYACEKGIYSRIPMHWDDAARTLSIGDREGSYPGMPLTRRFRVVLVRPDAGTALDRDACDAEAVYSGAGTSIVLK